MQCSESCRYILLGVAYLWLFVLSFGFILIFRLFSKLAKGSKQGSLKETLDNILDTEAKNLKGIKELEREIKRLQEEGELHVQKIGLIRFNPFRETGGDHSFSIALLDARDTGVVLTGLHTRERTRVYVKTVKNGKSEYELSNEEKKALTKAQKKR